MAKQLGKDPSDFSKEKSERFKFEQKSIGINAFNKLEEKKIKEKIEKRRQKRRELAEKNKALKPNKEREQEQIEEEQFWDKPNTLKKESRAIGNIYIKKVKDDIEINY